MLPPPVQALNRKLAVFRGGFTRAAAEQVAAARLPQLMALVDRSFLRLDEKQRFRRHPLLLQFAREQLAAQPAEQAQTEAAQARYFADLVQALEPELQGPKALDALHALGADLENVRTAWQWGLAHGEAALLDQMVTGIGRFFADRSRYLEGAIFFEECLPAAGSFPQSLLAKIETELGYFWLQTGRTAEAEAVLQTAVHRAKEHNLTRTRQLALRHLGELHSSRGDRSTARPYLEEALALCRLPKDAEQQLLILWRRGILFMNDGDYEQAQADFDKAMALAEGLGNLLHIARLHNSIAIIANRCEAYKQAIHHWQLARQDFESWDYAWGLAVTSHNLAMAYASLEQYEAAMENIVVATAMSEKIGHKSGVAGSLAVMASIYMAQGQRRQARQYYASSIRLAQEIGATWLTLVSLVDLAHLEMLAGQLTLAAQILLFVIRHPAAVAATVTMAQKLLGDLEAELPAGAMAEAESAVSGHTLESLIDQLIQMD